jgi:hypothetical protein
VESILFFLAGDVMLARGIDQILKYPSEPTLSYVWGDVLKLLENKKPNVR